MNEKKFIKIIKIIILILILLILITFLIPKRKNIKNIPQEIAKKESDEQIAGNKVVNYKVEQKGSSKTAIDEINVLITFQSDEKIKSIKYLGKDKEEQENSTEIYGSGKNSISIDYKIKTLKNYYFIVTTEKNSQEEIVINEARPYKIEVNGMTATGFKINLNLTEEEIKNIKEIKYYVNNTKEGTNYQTSNEVLDLGDSDIRYVWTNVIFNNGDAINSNNYVKVVMAHTHNSKCYSNIATTYAYQSSGSAYGDTRGILHCSDCGKSFIGSGNPKKYISSVNSFKNLNSDGTISKATWHATSHQTSWYIDSWTSGNGDVKVRDRVCVSCGTYLVSYCINAPSYAPPTRCGHYSKTLTCTKSTFTTQKSYDF